MNEKYDFKKRNKHIMERPSISSIQKINNQNYHLLIVEDQIQYYNQSTQFVYHKYICHQIARDMSVLLFLSDQQFFQHLSVQDSLSGIDLISQQEKQKQKSKQKQVKFRLRALLSSCLQVFSRESYFGFGQGKSRKVLCSQRCTYWQKLKEIVLMIFKRISNPKVPQERMILLNGWYLDTCKLLDICQIYGEIYKSAVTQIVRNVFTKGEALEDYQKDFHTVLELFYGRLMQLCEQLQRYSGINFAQLQKSNQLYRNFHNAQQTLAKSLAKTLFSAYDLIKNLSLILQFFPSRCKVQLLENSLIFKRLIMLYNKIRYYNQQEWRFGTRESQFKPLIEAIQCSQINFIARSLMKISMLIKQLPSQSPHRFNLKRTFVNFWHFTLIVAAVSYEYRQNEVRLSKAKYHGKQLCYIILKNITVNILSTQIIDHFDKKNKSFESIKAAKKFLKDIKDNQTKMQGLKRMQQWKLPSFKQFVFTLNEQQRKLRQAHVKQYKDQPLFDDQHFFIRFQHSNQEQLQRSDKQVEQSTEKTQKDQQKMQSQTKKSKNRQDGLYLFEELQYSSIGAASQHIFSAKLNDDSKGIESESLDSSVQTFFS